MSSKSVLLAMFGVLLFGCSTLEELPPPNNPFDPANPDYEGPAVEMLSGPVSGETVASSSVVFTWQGNATATETRSRLGGGEWSEWGNVTSRTFEYLDEGGYQLEVMARSLNGAVQEIPTSVDFEVDAVPGPAALVYPFLQTGTRGDTLRFEIVLEEVADLFAVEVKLNLDLDNLELVEVTGGELNTHWDGQTLEVTEVTGAEISYWLVAVEGSNLTFTGRTSVLNVVATIKDRFGMHNFFTDAITITELVLLDQNLARIEQNESRQGVLFVK